MELRLGLVLQPLVGLGLGDGVVAGLVQQADADEGVAHDDPPDRDGARRSMRRMRGRVHPGDAAHHRPGVTFGTARRGDKVDADPHAAAAASALVTAAGLGNVTVREGRAEETGLEAGSLEVVMLRRVLAHNGGAEDAIVAHLATLVGPGGCLYLPAPAPLVDPWRWQPQPGQAAPLAQRDSVQPRHHPQHPDTEPAQVCGADRRQHPGRERRPQRPQEEHRRVLVRRAGSETPPGHWNLMAQWLSRRHRHALDQDANGSMLGASATVRKGTSFVEPATDTRAGVPAADVTISWHTFEDAANEAGLSRRYGIHWQLGRRLGLARSTAWSDPSLAWSGQG